MPTTPTDDAPDRKVGVHGYVDLAANALKREALLFDQIAIPTLIDEYPYEPGVLDDLSWLRDIGVVRDVPPMYVAATPRQHLEVFVAETGQPIDMAIPDFQIGYEIVRRLHNALGTPAALVAYGSRVHSIDLRREGINAFPILETRRQIGNVFPPGTTPDTNPVLEVILKSMPMPDDRTAWQDIIEFRNDPESMKRLKALRVWVQEFAQDGKTRSLIETTQKLEVLLDEYEAHMKLHRMKVNKGATETLITVAGKVAEDLVKLKWGELAKLPFILKERKISLLEAEAKAPNRELAFISIARERFSR